MMENIDNDKDKELACAVIHKAIDDYRGVGNPKPLVVDTNSARAFLRGKTYVKPGVSCLSFWCEVAGMSVNNIQRVLFSWEG